MTNGKGRKGFSLAELLIVVAIIAVLLAIAIPNVIGYYRSLKLTELDDSARSIFVAAQNRLTALKSAGTDLTKLGGTEIEVTVSGGTAKVNPVTESDDLAALVPGGSIDPQLHDNHYVVEIDPKTGAVFAVWYWEKESFDYKTDAYNSVSPDKNDRLDAGKMVGYYGGDKIDRLTFKQMPFPNVKLINAEELRVEITVPAMSFGTGSGYHDDNVLVDVLVDGVTIVKDAKLWPDNNPGKSRVGTVVLDTLKTTAYNDNYNESSGPSDGALSWTYGMQYKEWVKKLEGADKELPQPGEDLTVAVKLHYNGTVNINGTDTNLMPQTVIVQGNSLFESVDGGTAKIAYGRHLQNLDDTSGVTGITGAKQIRDINFAATAKDSADPIYYYWGSTYPAPDESFANGQDKFRDFHEIYNGALNEYDGQDHEIRNMYIVAENGYGGLFSMVEGGSYHNITIVNPHVHEAPDPDQTKGQGASVGALIGMAVGDVEIRECKVYVDYDPEKDTPELKGHLDQVLTNKLDNMTIGKNPKGNCYVEALLGFPHIEGAESGSSAGGLVGLFTGNILIQDSFCSIPVVGDTNAGGLVGVADTISIKNSYSASFVYGCGYVGGLVGLAGDSYSEIKIENCYAAGEIMNGDPSSFIGAGLVNIEEKTPNDKIAVKNNYSAVKFVNATGEPKTGGGGEKQGTVYGTYNGDNSSANYYIADPAVTKGYGQQASGDPVPCGTAVKAAELPEKFRDKSGWNVDPTAGAGKTHPYRLLTELNGLPDVYPYPMLTDMPHYGDWLGETVSPSSLCYYDVVDGDYGVWGYIVDPANPGTLNFVNTLASGTAGSVTCATDDGYGVLVKDGETVPALSGISGISTDTSPIDVTIDGTNYDLYKIDTTSFTSTDYYTKITVGETDYWFNPFFACEVQKPGTGDITTAEPMAKTGAAGDGSTLTGDYTGKVVIRTARQLANMAAQTGSSIKDNGDKPAQLRKYEQLLDIDYNSYTGTDLKVGTNSTNAQTPAALCRKKDTINETGGYNGNGFFIKNLYIKAENNTSKNVGLFGEIGISNQGKIENITLVNVAVNGNSCANVGALAGYVTNSTILENCGVYVENGTDYGTFTVTGGNYVGGLVGILGSSTQATNCFAAVEVKGKDAVGGFVGQMNGSKGIGNCYSGGHTEGGEYKNASINVTATDGSAGGFVGKLLNYQNTLENNTGTVTSREYKAFNVIENSILYSTCSVSGKNVGLFAGEVSEASKQTNPEVTEVKDAAGNVLPFDNIETELNGITVYGTGKAFNSSGDEAVPREETYLNTPAVTAKGSGFKTRPYDIPTLDGKDYPYQTNLNEHYGDWVMPKFQVSGYIYWELEGGAYHYSVTAWDREKGATDWTGLTINPTLCNEYDTAGISNYGYGWFYAGDFDGGSPTMTDASGGTEDTSAKGALESSLKTALETALPGVDLGTVTVTAYSYNSTTPVGQAQTWNIQQGSKTLQTATLNPDFADTITTGGTVDTPYKVRTIRQLQHINHTAYLDKTFEQGHDLDGTGVTDYTPIGNGTTNGFTGEYDGQGYRIMSLSIDINERHANAGLFGKASGEASFEHIIMLGNGKTISASDSSGNLAQDSRARVGGIVAEIPSGAVTISNCVVAGYKLEASATGNIFCTSKNVYVGGIVANLNGTVKNCEAVVNIKNNSGSAYIGGLVGEIGSGNVTNSYAGGNVTTSDTTCVGGLVGKATSDNQIMNSFSYVTGAHYAIDGNGGTHRNCAYLGTNNTRNNGASQYMDVVALNTWLISNATFHYAEHVYDGSGEVSGATFNGAVVQVPTEPDGVPVYVHYGDWPNP